MAINISPVEISNTFQGWLNKTNELVELANNNMMTASPIGDTTVGNATLVGNFNANNLSANTSSGAVSGFVFRASEIRQNTGNLAPIDVKDIALFSGADEFPLRVINTIGPKIRLDSGTVNWDFGIVGNSPDAAFTFNRNGTQNLAITNQGHLTLSGTIRSSNSSNTVAAFGFAADVGAGMSRVANNSLSFLTGGAERLRIVGDSFVFKGAVSTNFNIDGFLDLNINKTEGIRIGRNSLYSKLSFFQPNTSTTKIFLSASDNVYTEDAVIRMGNKQGPQFPAYSFIDDSGTGIYSSLSSTLSIATGSARRATFNNTVFDLNVGMSFGSTAALQNNNLSRHIALFGTSYGFNATSSSINVVLPAAATVNFVDSSTANTVALVTGGGNFQGTAGSASAPSFSFLNNFGTGMFSAGLNSASFATGGIEQWRINVDGDLLSTANGKIRLKSGTALDLSITFMDDLSTGLFYSPIAKLMYAANNNVLTHRFDGNLGVSYSIVTKALGDNRYALSSSIRFKEDIGHESEEELSKRLLFAFDKFKTTSWTWGGEIIKTDERWGEVGVGFIAEDVEKFLPEAVRYQWVSQDEEIEIDAPMNQKQPNALDPFPIIASLVEKIRQLETRLEVITGKV